jgi:uncharacterized membrane protein
MITIAALAFGVFFLLTAIAHLVFPAYFRGLVPDWIRRPGLVVVATAGLEAVIGVFVLVPHTRSCGAWAAAVLLTLYLPAHLEPLRKRRNGAPRLRRPSTVPLNVGVNLGYIAWALWIALG